MRFFRRTKLSSTKRARQLLNNKGYDELIEFLEKKHAEGEISANTYYFMGKAWYFKGNEKKSLMLFNKALELEPEDAKIYTAMGKAYYWMDEDNKAKEFFLKAINYDKSQAEAYIGVADVYENAQEYSEALDWAKKALKYDKDNHNIYNTLGSIYMRTEKYTDAAKVFQKALKITNDVDFLYSNSCFVYMMLEEYDKSIEYGAKSIELNPQNSSNYYYYGQANFNKGDFKSSVEAFEKALELDADDKTYKEHLERAKEALQNQITEAPDQYFDSSNTFPDKIIDNAWENGY
ncbi:MAG: hypothetical protein DRJ10_05460, partial [Bacteroidetes bacterium]